MAGTEANGGLPQAIFRTIGLVSIAMMVLEYKLDVFGFGKGRDLGEVSPGIVERRHVGIEDVASADLKRALDDIGRESVVGRIGSDLMSILTTWRHQGMPAAQITYQLGEELSRRRGEGARINKQSLRQRYNGSCRHRGRVFGVGVTKTGTSSLISGLDLLNYTSKGPTNGVSFMYGGAYSGWWDDFAAGEVIEEWAGSVKYSGRTYYLDKTLTAGDIPWLFMYKELDTWYPDSKFILTLRRSPSTLVNSEINMWRRGQRSKFEKRNQQNEANIVDQEDFQGLLRGQRTGKYALLYDYSVADFTVLSSRRYDLHNKAVREHFKRSGKLLEICFECEAEKGTSPWEKITKFLGCPQEVSRNLPEFPHIKRKNPNFTRGTYVTDKMLEKGGEYDWKEYSFQTAPMDHTQPTRMGSRTFLVRRKNHSRDKTGGDGIEHVCSHCKGFRLH
ncbi:hypothetical protein AAMO2058_001361700 [Amorphochlora amoebiformis]